MSVSPPSLERLLLHAMAAHGTAYRILYNFCPSQPATIPSFMSNALLNNMLVYIVLFQSF